MKKSLKLSTDESTHIVNRPYVAIALWCRLTSRLWLEKPTRSASARAAACMPDAKGSSCLPGQNGQNSKLSDGAYFWLDGYPSVPVVLIKPLAYFPRCARARAVLCKLVVIRSGGVLAGSCQDADRVYGVLPGQTVLALSDKESIKSSARLIVGVEQRKSGH